ncbi:MAG: rhomboid family intramembrane serine protease [Nitrososphaerota archaeon]|nr:rhomboid family intramembrane serine protease [Nitrososphaerota archaeon]MDG6922287.1 rhomboid family intramembrane serine protease [Nitrososphaerota archaeon]
MAQGATFCTACGEDLNPPIADSSSFEDKSRKCYYCGKPFAGENTYYYRCRYCERDFCSEHRLPESHLCKSNPLRRNIPSTSMPYYSTASGYYSSTGSSRRAGGFSINISKQGRNLALLIVAGLPIGFVLSLISFSNVPLVYYLTQYNALVYLGWIPPLLTSMIVVYPSYLGLEDVFFNAIFVIFVDRILAATYTVKQYYAVFLLGGLAGNILSLLGGPNVLSFGASGGLFGLIAGAVTYDYAISRRVNTSLLTWFVIVFVFSSIAGSVDVFAHLGGAVVGLVVGYIIGSSKHNNFRR